MKEKKKHHPIIVILVVIVAIIVVAAAGAIITANHYLDKINKVDADDIETIPPEEEDFETDYIVPETEVPTPDETFEITEDVEPSGIPAEMLQPEDVTWEEVETYASEKHVVNIMLVGQDRRPGERRARSDSMILCSINTKTGNVSMISFLRDLYVQIPGYSDNRLNVAYAFGGFPLMYSTFSKNFGINIDNAFMCDFDAFDDIIDVLGGVDINLTAAEAGWIGHNLVAGVNHLDGELALAYARIRKLDSDFGRTARQRNVLNAIFNKFKNSDLATLNSLLDKVLPYISTDMSNKDILALAAKILPNLSSMEISTYTVPASDAYKSAVIRGMMVLVPDLTKINNSLRNEYLQK